MIKSRYNIFKKILLVPRYWPTYRPIVGLGYFSLKSTINPRLKERYNTVPRMPRNNAVSNNQIKNYKLALWYGEL